MLRFEWWSKPQEATAKKLVVALNRVLRRRVREVSFREDTNELCINTIIQDLVSDPVRHNREKTAADNSQAVLVIVVPHSVIREQDPENHEQVGARKSAKRRRVELPRHAVLLTTQEANETAKDFDLLLRC
jgi:hypothetical protein